MVDDSDLVVVWLDRIAGDSQFNGCRTVHLHVVLKSGARGAFVEQAGWSESGEIR